MEAMDQEPDSRDEFLDKMMLQLSKKFGGSISFVGVINEKAKTMYSEKSRSGFPLDPVRENVLGVQLSLSFSMLKQIENLLGNLSHIILTYEKHDIVLAEIVSNSIIYVICDKGHSGAIVNALTALLDESPSAKHSKQPDYNEHEWSGS